MPRVEFVFLGAKLGGTGEGAGRSRMLLAWNTLNEPTSVHTCEIAYPFRQTSDLSLSSHVLGPYVNRAGWPP
jgi:hypothetical protein